MVESNSIESDSIEASNLNNQQFRINKINEIKDYFIAEIKKRELMSKRLTLRSRINAATPTRPLPAVIRTPPLPHTHTHTHTPPPLLIFGFSSLAPKNLNSVKRTLVFEIQ